MNELANSALIAAMIAGVVSALSWYVAYERERRLEWERRSERVRDYKIALRAEISCHIERWAPDNPEDHIQGIAQQIRAGDKEGRPHTPFIPREADNTVFNAISLEIQILPADVIEPVIRYYEQVSTIAQLVEDMRTEQYERLDSDKKIEIYRDYIELRLWARTLAEEAVTAIDNSTDDV